jgi:hypothetical protein
LNGRNQAVNQEETKNSDSTVFTSLVTTLTSATRSKPASRQSAWLKRGGLKTREDYRNDIAEQLKTCSKETGDGCVVWAGERKYGTQYGCVARWHKKSDLSTSRAAVCAWELANGKLEKGYRVYLTCKNDMCIKLDHMTTVTLSERSQLARRGK